MKKFLSFVLALALVAPSFAQITPQTTRDGRQTGFAPTVVRQVNLAPVTPSSWSSAAGSATVTTSQAAPDGTTGAGKLSSSSTDVDYRRIYATSRAFAAGDWLVAGVWVKRASGATGGMRAWPAATVKVNDASYVLTNPQAGSTLTSSRSLLATVAADTGWEWLAISAKITTIGTSPAELRFELNCDVNRPVVFYAPTLHHITAGTLSDLEVETLRANLFPVPTGTAAGTLAKLPAQTTNLASSGVPTTVFNVVTDYNAVGDDVANDTSVIQAAIDAAEAVGGGIVYLPRGIFLVTGLSVEGRVILRGAGEGVTIIHSTTNATIVDLTADAAFLGGGVEQLTIRGSISAGSSQHGIKVDDGTYGLRFTVRDCWIENTGGYGLYWLKGFSSIVDNVFITNCASYPLLYDGANQPGNVFQSVYVGNLRSSATTAFRIKSGEFNCNNCNGVNSVPTGTKWAVVGKKNGVDGDGTDAGATLNCTDCNIESFDTHGILAYSSSTINVLGKSNFAGNGNTAQKGIEFDLAGDGSSYFSPFLMRGTIADTVDFADGASAYANSQPIHANGFAPIQILGQGPLQGGSPNAKLTTYYNATATATLKLARADGNLSVLAVTGDTTISQPGVRYIEANCSAACAITLPWPGWYARAQEVLIVKDKAGSAATYNITLQSGGGGTVNGGSFILDKNGQAVVLVPDGNTGAGDWRIINSYPEYKLISESAGGVAVAGTLVSTDSYVEAYSSSGGAAGSFFLRRHRGASGSPTAVQNGDALGYIAAQGQYSSTAGQRNTGAYITFSTTENFSGSAAGTKIQFSGAENGSTDGFSKKFIFDPSNGGGSLYPGTTNAQSLGIAGNAWNNLYLRNDAPAYSRMFAQTAKVTVANTVTETTLLSGAGTLTIDANSVSAGTTYEIEAWGYGAKSSSTTRWKLKLGSLTLCDSTALGWAPTGNRMWSLKAIVTIYTTGASGTLAAEGVFRMNTTATAETIQEALNTGTATIDTTTTNAFDLTVQHGATGAGNTVSLLNFVIRRAQ